MKKTLLFLFLNLSLIAGAQTFIAQDIVLSTTAGLEYTASIETNETEVILTMIGPADRWLGLGFGVSGMTAGGDVVIFDGTDLTDMSFVGGFVQPQLDEVQNWTILSNIVEGDVRTLIATRDLDAGSINYVFENNGESIPLVWARGNGSTFAIANHGGGNRGIAVAEFQSLSNQDFEISSWAFYPNPSNGWVSVNLPQELLGENIEMYDLQGKRVLKKKVTQQQEKLQLSALNAGQYLLRITKHPNTERLILK